MKAVWVAVTSNRPFSQASSSKGADRCFLLLNGFHCCFRFPCYLQATHLHFYRSLVGTERGRDQLSAPAACDNIPVSITAASSSSPLNIRHPSLSLSDDVMQRTTLKRHKLRLHSRLNSYLGQQHIWRSFGFGGHLEVLLHTDVYYIQRSSLWWDYRPYCRVLTVPDFSINPSRILFLSILASGAVMSTQIKLIHSTLNHLVSPGPLRKLHYL